MFHLFTALDKPNQLKQVYIDVREVAVIEIGQKDAIVMFRGNGGVMINMPIDEAKRLLHLLNTTPGSSIHP